MVYPPGQVLSIENTLRISAHGSDTRDTEELLTSISNRFGNIASFTGTYRANTWRLTIHRQNPDSSEWTKIEDTEPLI